MKKIFFFASLILLLFFSAKVANAQLPTKIVSGQIFINDGSLVPKESNYTALENTLDKTLKTNPSDTTALFSRAMLYLQFNNITAKPNQSTKGALENLTIAEGLAEKAISLKMQAFSLKVLRAQIYKELAYRFTGDESWKYNANQITERKHLFNTYKDLANKYYDELAALDRNNAYDYKKLKVNTKYLL